MQHLDLRYADTHERNTLDLFLPPGAANPPLVVYIHGGAFFMGDKASDEGNAATCRQALLDAGFAVASVNYRYSKQAIWPAQLHDLDSAFAFLRANAARFGFDARRIASFGPSAGGHLSAMAGIAFAASAETRLAAAVVWFPPVDFPTMDADMIATGTPRVTGRNDAPGSPESILVGAVVADNPDIARSASPLTYLARLPQQAVLPAFLIMHGALDPYIAPAQAQRLQDGLQARGANTRLIILPQGTHGGGQFEEAATLDAVTQFLRTAFAA